MCQTKITASYPGCTLEVLSALRCPEWCLDVPRSDVSDVLIMLIADVGTIGSDDSAQTLKDNRVFLMAAEEYSIFSTSLIQSIADVYEAFSTPVENKLSDGLIAITTELPCNYCKYLLL